MKNRRLLMSLVLALSVFTSALFAKERSYSDIKNVALNFAKEHHKQVAYQVKPKSVYSTRSMHSNKNYEIVNLEPKGWVIVSKDDIAKPVLGYALDKNLDTSKPLPPAFAEWLNNIDKEIKQGKKQRVSQKTFKGQWKKLATEPEIFENNQLDEMEATTDQTVEPLLGNIKWGQSAPYDAQVVEHTEARVPVGCVATAMVQVMKYWGWPSRGTSSHSYEHSKYGTLSANFNTSYNWAAMPDKGTTANSDLAKISYHVGVSVNMGYGVGSSGAYPSKMGPALTKYFHYKTEGYKRKDSMTDAQWHAALKSNLDGHMPLVYVGFGSGGHAFVCDGYKYENNSKTYHFNWGWDGYYNGWFEIGALNPGGSNFNNGTGALFGIQPNIFEKARITSPTANSTLKSDKITVRWNKNSASKVLMTVYNPAKRQYLSYGYSTGTSKTVSVPTNGEKILVDVYSYDEVGHYKGRDRIYVTTKKVLFKNAKITSPTANSTLTGNKITVRWNKNSASKVLMTVYNPSKRQYLSYGYSTGTSKTVSVPTNGEKILVDVYSYDASGHYKGRDRIYLNAKKTAAASFRKAKITSPTANGTLKSDKITVRWNKNSASKVLMTVYNPSKRQYLSYGYSTGTSKTVSVPANGAKILVDVYSYDASGRYKGRDRIYLNAKK